MSVEPEVFVSAPQQNHVSLTPEIIENLNIDAENEIAKVLQVPDFVEINEETQKINETDSIKRRIKPTKPEQYVPGGVKTRADLIQKIQETAEICGNEAEVKSMRLHRRRRNSLDNILREQFTKCVTQEAEKRMGIPPSDDEEGRISYAVNALYNFDLCVCKLIEKSVDYLDMGATCEGLSATIDGDPRIRKEIKKSFRDWLLESGHLEYAESFASPTTRLLLCHLYPLISCLRAKQADQKPKEIPLEVSTGIATAVLRNTIDPPRCRPKLPCGIKLV